MGTGTQLVGILRGVQGEKIVTCCTLTQFLIIATCKWCWVGMSPPNGNWLERIEHLAIEKNVMRVVVYYFVYTTIVQNMSEGSTKFNFPQTGLLPDLLDCRIRLLKT